MKRNKDLKGQKLEMGIVGLFLIVLVAGCATSGHYNIDKNYTLGRKYYEAGRYQQAIEYYLQHTSGHPDSLLNEVVFYHLGRSYQQLEDYEKAKEYYQKLTKKYKDGFWADLAREEMKKLEKMEKAK